MEGVSLEARYMLESIRATGAQTKPVITISGGATKSATWRQVLADTMNATCRTLEVEESAVLGAACLAAVGGGLLPNLQQAAEQMVHYQHTVDPIPGNVAIYDRSYQAYSAAYTALNDGGVFDLLNKINPEESE